MTFKVIDTKTGKEPTSRVIDNIARKGGLMTMDIDQFFVGEDGALVLADDCGKITYCDTKRFKVEPQESEYKRAFKVACELLNDDVLYGYDRDRIFAEVMQAEGVFSSEDYERFILQHLDVLSGAERSGEE